MAEIEAKCQLCGKPVSVLEPSRWGYKVKEKNGWIYYCSWKCLRAEEKRIEQAEQKKKEARKAKQQEKFLNNRLEVLKGMMEAVSEGKNAYDYLKSMGYADPKDTLRRLRITAKEEAPKIYRKMEKMGLLDLRKGHSGKGVDRMSQNKLTREQKGKAVDIAIQGGDPLAYLRECGAKNPTAAWWYIKKTLATKNPQLLEKIPEKIGTVLNESGQVAARVEIAEKLQPEAAAEVPEADPMDGFVPVSLGGPVAMSQEEHQKAHHGDEAAAFLEAANVFRTIMNPNGKEDKFDGFQVTAVNGKFGQYRVGIDPSSKEKYFDFDGLDFDTQIRMPQHDLAAFVEELTRAAQILGVDAG